MVDKRFLDDFFTQYPEFKDLNLDEKTMFYKAISYVRENFNVSFTKIDNAINLSSKNSTFKIYELQKTERYILQIILKTSSFSSVEEEQYHSFVYDPFSDHILNINIKNLKLQDSEKFEIKEDILNVAVSKFLENNNHIFDKYTEKIDRDTELEKTKIKEYFETLEKEIEQDEKKLESKISELSEKLRDRNEQRDQKTFERFYKDRENLYKKLAALKDKNNKKREELKDKERNILTKLDKNLKLKLEVCGVLVIKYDIQNLNLFIEEPGFSKFIVYDSLKDEHDLNCKCGKNITNFIITKKDEIICEDCAIKCDECGNYFSRFDSYHTCSVCNKNLCEDCSHICFECGEYFCKDHIYKCEVCNKPICENCKHKCSICGMDLCKEHTHRCAICDREVCGKHSGKCSICGREACSEDLVYCNLCGRKVCKDHARIDSLDNKYYCVDDIEECSYCGKYYSKSHIQHCKECEIAMCENDAQHCAVCNAPLCNDHVYRCEVCGKPLCNEHTFKCDTCQKTLCDEHIEKCSICGKIECADHIYTCSICGEKVCKDHIKNQICDTCMRRKEIKEDFIVFEILKKYNLPRRGMWSKSENQQNIFYYNENRELLVFKLIKNSGEIVRVS
ncbi:MAG: hypothetical protein ACP5NL_05410 [Thermoplasmata archaeon]